MRLPASFDVLRERNFARYLAAVVVAQLGNGMANVALAFAVLGFGTPTDLGIVLLSREVPMIAFLLLGGVFADRHWRGRDAMAIMISASGATASSGQGPMRMRG